MDLEAIKARAETATPGPWMVIRETFNGGWTLEGIVAAKKPVLTTTAKGVFGCHPVSDDDAEFIAHAREDIPVLVAEIVRLREGAENAYNALHERADKIAAYLYLYQVLGKTDKEHP